MDLANKLARLRVKEGVSQEKLSEAIGTTRQAVQKWEQGTSQPGIDNLIKIARFFNMSLDSLVLGLDDRFAYEFTMNKKHTSKYSNSMNRWEDYSCQLKGEFWQFMDEGKDLAEYENIFMATNDLPRGELKTKIADMLFELGLNAKIREDYKYEEPSDLESILLCRPDGRIGFGEPDKEKLYDKIYGAWIGRVCGCMLGKPVEGIRSKELVPFLKDTGNYPMSRYIYNSELTEEICSKYEFDFRVRGTYPDLMTYAYADDDTTYTVMAKRLVDIHGIDFTPEDVCNMWLRYLPEDSFWTAEHVAFRNFVTGYTPPESAEHKNPYRECIGAQIRTDYYGYINPGDPETAAKMAWRDACISHTKNGIYGAMFVAAMIAAAAVIDDNVEIIKAGLGQIPKNCRLAEAVNIIVDMYKSGKTQRECFKYIAKRYDEYGADFLMTVSNAVICVASVLYGEGDYGKSICLAVETAFDTDCNGATVGSVLGMRNGFSNIPEYWYKPFNDTVGTSYLGCERENITALAKDTLKIATR